MEKWKEFFASSEKNIFSVIENAILVAARENPEEFRLRRDRIAETLFTCLRTVVPANESSQKVELDKIDENESEDEDEDEDEQDDMKIAEALNDEIEEETRNLEEVFRIKRIVRNWKDESDTVILDSLRRLQLMGLSVDVLQRTMIGKAVTLLRKHSLKEIRILQKTLLQGWKALVAEWCAATDAIAKNEGGTPDSVNPSALDEEEEGLPSPPMDDFAFLAIQPTSMELGGFFDDVDEDGNPQDSGELKKRQENGRNPRVKTQKNEKNELLEKQQTAAAPGKPPIPSLPAVRPIKPCVEQKVHTETKLQQKSERTTVQRMSLVSQQDKPRCPDKEDLQAKLEVTQKRLRENYQQVEKAKKQRTIQVMDLQDLPKQSLGHKNAHLKPATNKPGTNRRR